MGIQQSWKGTKASIFVCTSAQPLTFIHSSFGLISTGFIRLRWKTKIKRQATTAKLKIGKLLGEVFYLLERTCSQMGHAPSLLRILLASSVPSHEVKVIVSSSQLSYSSRRG